MEGWTPMFQVQHYRKLQTAVGCRNVIAHNMRENIYDRDGNEITNPQKAGDWYEPERANLNSYSKDIEKPEDALKKRNDRIKEANLVRKPQKNASYAIEGVFSASPEMAEEWKNSSKDLKTWNKYLDKSRKWAEKQFGKDNVLHTAIHMDETTPHLHVVMVPIMEKDGKNRYSSSNFLGGPAGLKKLHTEYHRAVGKDFGLERGVEGSRAKHQTLEEHRLKVDEFNRVTERMKLGEPLKYQMPPEENFFKRNFSTHKVIGLDGKERKVTYKTYRETQRSYQIVKMARDAENENVQLKDTIKTKEVEKQKLENEKKELLEQNNDLKKENKDLSWRRAKNRENLRIDELSDEQISKIFKFANHLADENVIEKKLAQEQSKSITKEQTKTRKYNLDRDDGGWGLG